MDILVFIKQVPDDSVEVNLDETTGKPAIDGITPVVNAFDTYALEMAARFKETNGGSVTVACVGPEQVKDSLKSCLAVGADKAYQITDSAFDGSDTLSTSYLLSCIVPKIEEMTGSKFDLIFCGKETTDSSTGQVGPQLAEQMGLPLVTNVIAVEPLDAGVSIKQETEEGYHIIEASTPCVVTITRPNYDPRYPTMKSKLAARKMPIPVLTTSELLIDTSKVGAANSPTKVVRTFSPPKKEAGVKIQEKTAEEAVAKAMELMTEAKVF